MKRYKKNNCGNEREVRGGFLCESESLHKQTCMQKRNIKTRKFNELKYINPEKGNFAKKELYIINR